VSRDTDIASEVHFKCEYSLFEPVPSVLWAPKHWRSQWQDTGGPQEPDPRGGNRKSLQGRYVSVFDIYISQ